MGYDTDILFEIEGMPCKKVFRPLRSYIAVSPYHLYIELDGDSDSIDIRDVFNIFIREPVTFDIPSRTTVIDYYFEGEEMRYELEDEIFPGLSYRFDLLLETCWPHFKEKKQLPQTVRWFNACCAMHYIAEGMDPGIFGGVFDTMEASVGQKKVLEETWGIHNRKELREQLGILLEGGTAWDLVRLLLFAASGFVCGYLSHKGALDICLEGGQKLQRLFSGWDSMAQSYLQGYAVWSRQDLSDENSKTYDRWEIHQNLKELPQGPYAVGWQYPLCCEW